MIRKSQIVAALAAVGTLTCGVAAYGQALPRATDVFAPYGSSGNWNVFVNTTRGNCFAERRDETAVLQMGITKPPVFGYMGVFTQAPTDLQSGRVEKITIEMRGRTFIGEVTEAAGNIRGGFSGGYVVSQDAGFIEEVAGASTMKVTVEGREPMEISLAGTARAIDAVRACNEAQSG